MNSKKQRDEECIINSLPVDIIERIFFRLPVSTLLRCIGVCKQWLNFIRDPQFVKSHLQHAHHCALIFFPPGLIKGEPYPADAILIDEAWSPSTCAVPVIGPDDFLFGSCNGLLGLYTKTSIKIANLATGECLHLEKPMKNLKGDHFSLYTFGFHPVTKEYKITHFLGDFVEGRPNSKDIFSVIQVYTLGDEKWKDIRIPEALRLKCAKNSGVLNVDGTLYWLTEDMTASWQHAVMSFDLKGESFTPIQLPDVLLDSAHHGPRQYLIRELDGKVCVATAQTSNFMTRMLDGQLQIWILDNKVDQTWSLKYSIQGTPVPDYIPGPYFYHGDKIMTPSRNDNLYSYELLGESPEITLGNSVTLLFDFSPRKQYRVQSYICVKSLVSLDVYKKAGIVHRPKQRDDWKLKKWEAWNQELDVIEDVWNNILKLEQDISEMIEELGNAEQMLQHEPREVFARISMEISEVLRPKPDGAVQLRSLRRLNWVAQKRDKKKLVARSHEIDETIKSIKQARHNISSIVQGYMVDQGISIADVSSQRR